MANGLMPLYYRQQARREAKGSYAVSLADLGVPTGQWLLWPGDASDAPDAAPLPDGWALEMTGGADWFRATLTTPLGVAVIDDTGKLERTP
jgi:hypothetical protein